MITHDFLIPIQTHLYVFPKSHQTPLIPYAPPLFSPHPLIHLPNILQKPRQIPSLLRPQPPHIPQRRRTPPQFPNQRHTFLTRSLYSTYPLYRKPVSPQRMQNPQFHTNSPPPPAPRIRTRSLKTLGADINTALDMSRKHGDDATVLDLLYECVCAARRKCWSERRQCRGGRVW